MTILRMEDIDLEDKRVLIRQDLNVPLEQGRVVNDTRIRASLPSIELALAAGARVILMSHLGRPKEGTPINEQPEASMRAVAEVLQRLLPAGKTVRLVENYLENAAHAIPGDNEVLLLENVRINSGEKANDDSLSQRYAALCDLFVMDAFGTAHRAQASTHGVAKFAPSCCAGPLLSKELDALTRSLESPERPMLAIVGGAKVSSKLEVLESMAKKVDRLIVGGGIANTFMAANGLKVGKSLYEPDLIAVAKRLMETTEIPIPVDVLVAKTFSIEAEAVSKDVEDIADDDLILDVGAETSRLFAEIIREMKTIIWNGPIGVFEFPQFARGTEALAKAIAENEGFSIAGGGETITAIDQFQVTHKVSYISTGGGAFLEFMQGEVLPAVDILDR